MSEDTNLINLQLQLQNFVGEGTPEAFGKAVNVLDTSIRRGIPEDKFESILDLRKELIKEWQRRAKIEQLKTELSQAPGRLDNESIVELEQAAGPAGGPPSFTLPASETRQEIGRIISTAPLAGTGKHFAKAIVREPTSPTDLAPTRLSPDQIFRLNELGMSSLVPQLQPSHTGEKTVATNDLAVFVGSSGKIRPPSIPLDMTLDQGKASLKSLAEQRQILVPEALGQRIDIARATGEATATGQAIVTAQDKLNELRKSRTITDSILGLADVLMTAESPAASTLQGGKLHAQARLPGVNTLAKAYLDQKAQFSGQLSRSLGGERGVLTEGDIGRIVGGFPGFADPKSLKDYKKGTINLIIDAAIEAQQARIEGRDYNTQKFRARINNLVKELTVPIPALPHGARIIGEIP